MQVPRATCQHWAAAKHSHIDWDVRAPRMLAAGFCHEGKIFLSAQSVVASGHGRDTCEFEKHDPTPGRPGTTSLSRMRGYACSARGGWLGGDEANRPDPGITVRRWW
ncbi:unnamed protein product [Symbiodinium sp. CCMP2592]|nr:unnamed protein product [Symbiodinium sp. CCMP2592]